MADNTNMTPEQMRELITQLQAEKAKLLAPKTLSCKVSEKGALSLYGMGRFPVTLYREQWERLLDEAAPLVRSFIQSHIGELKTKAQSVHDEVADATADTVTTK